MRRVLDGIIGFVIGDALGVPVEFTDRQEIKKCPVISMREYGTHHQPIGTWSDDTSLTLALMDSLIKNNEINYVDIMERFSNWLMYNDYTATDEVFDVGNSTSRAIMNYARGMNPLECGGITEYENGNGSLMRILPLAYYLQKQVDRTVEDQMEEIHNVSALTHRHPISLIGCGIYIRVAMSLLEAASSLYTSVEQGIIIAFHYYENKYIDDLNAYSRIKNLSYFVRLSESEIRSSGYIVDTLEAVLWCLLNTNSYKECVLRAVNLGDDTDTVGAIAGGLAGIYYGLDQIPVEWMNVVAKKEYIEDFCNRLQKLI